VIGLAKARGIAVHERTILPEELGTFEECFLTGTAAEVTPVGEIGPHRYTPGAITLAMIDDYAAAVRAHPLKAVA
jgi:branched-chain amino acid aminotransferase